MRRFGVWWTYLLTVLITVAIMTAGLAMVRARVQRPAVGGARRPSFGGPGGR